MCACLLEFVYLPRLSDASRTENPGLVDVVNVVSVFNIFSSCFLYLSGSLWMSRLWLPQRPLWKDLQVWTKIEDGEEEPLLGELVGATSFDDAVLS